MISRFLLVSTTIAWASTASAQVTVQSSGAQYATLNEAVANANAVGGDTLTMAAGVYSEHVVIDRQLTIVGAGSDQVTVSHFGPEDAVIEIDPGVVLTISGVTVVSTSIRGIEAEDTNDLTLNDVVFDGTTSTADGGGLYAEDPTSLVLTNVTFDGTTAADGGGLAVTSATPVPVDLTDVTFTGTSASGDGGAIYLDTIALDCTGCTFDGTSANNGGGIFDLRDSDLVVRDSQFLGTSATLDGGAIDAAGTLLVTGSTFCGTTGTLGGAIAGAPVSALLATSVFIEPSAAAGGGIYAIDGAWDLENVTFAGVDGVAANFEGAATTADVVNTLFLDSSGFALGFGFGATATRIDHNAFSGNAGEVSGASLGSNNVTGAAPQLAAWSADGDCTNDVLVPLYGSPLVDAGDPAILDPDGSTSDIGASGGPGAAPHPDGDGDGFSVYRDCDDAEPLALPGGTEVCDTLDNDCSGLADDNPIDLDQFYEDCDGDGQGDAATFVEQCFAPTTGSCTWLAQSVAGNDAWSDCDDLDATVYAGADETCDDGDQNCDGDDDLFAIDAATYYADGDSDGHGGLSVALCELSAPPGHTDLGGDCNDGDGTVYPGAPDSCGDSVDQDCNGGDGDDTTLVDWFPDLDADGWGDPLAAPTTTCQDLSTSGFTGEAEALDCDDDASAVNPDAKEQCNTVDDDCNGTVDDVGPTTTWYEDTDVDGFGNEAFPVEDDCPPGPEWIGQGGDCDDDDPEVSPDAEEVCNELDDDCDAAVDAEDDDAVGLREVWPDFDGDGYGSCEEEPCPPERVCPDSLDQTADNPDDCNDANPAQNPGQTEVPKNDVDEDCDGVALDAPRPGLDDDDEGGGGGCNCDTGSGPAAWLAGWIAIFLVRRRS